MSFSRCLGDLSRTECTVLSSVDQASLWKQIMTEVEGRSLMKRSGALHLGVEKGKELEDLAQNAETTYFLGNCIVRVTHHSSLGSGSVLWRDIRSLTYWLNALLLHLQNRYFSNQSYVKRYLNKDDFEWLSSDFSN